MLYPYIRKAMQSCPAWVLMFLSLGQCAVLAAQDGEGPRPGGQVAATVEVAVEVRLQYLLYLPEEYEQGESWPLVLFLHGAGERGDDLEQVKRHGPPKLIAGGKSFPFIVASPQCPKGKRWKSVELIALIDQVCNEHKVDQDRIYVTGLSMGGFGTWEIAADYPDRLAAILPICGGGEPFWAGQIRSMPVWAFHGAKDQVVPQSRTDDMVAALRAAGGDPKLTVYPEAGHDSWTESYDNPELYSWMLKQSRKKETPGK